MGRASNDKKRRREEAALLEQPVLFKNERFTRVPLGLIQSIVMPVALITADDVKLIGTCFNILPSGLFVTAKHVVDEATKLREQYDGGWIGVSWTSPGSREKKRGLRGEWLEVRSMCSAEPFDIALMWLEENATGAAGGFPEAYSGPRKTISAHGVSQ
jgi:hypothetical protein